MSRGATALPAALAAVAVSAALAAAVVEIARIEALIARHRRTATAALLGVDACLAGVVADVAPAWDLGALLAGPDGLPATPDDGTLAPRPQCLGRARPAPGAPNPPRALVRLEATAAGGRRAVEALLGLAATPGLPALLWLGRAPAGAAIPGTVTLDGTNGADPTADWAGLAAPEEPAALDAWFAAEGGHVVVSARTRPALTAPAPPFAALAARIRAAGPAGAETLVPGAPAPALAYVAGDLAIGDARRGAGLLFVDGTLDIAGTLDFTGLMVVSGGVQIAAGGRLAVSGGLWAVAPAVPAPALVVGGDLAIRQDGDAVTAADALLPLPRRATLLGLRDLG